MKSFQIVCLITTFLTFFILEILTIKKTVILINFSLSSAFECFSSIYLILDYYSMVFVCTVFLVSGMVMLYSNEYMSGDMMKLKFSMIMIIFIFSMILMSTSSSLFWLMVGWDGLGLSSFCLIMYFQNWNSFNSAMVTFICNRVGDLFLISSIVLMISKTNSSCSWSFYSEKLEILSFLISMVAFSKSAQIPFSFWLPLAMAAPTPVSSLVHSSTLITAGVYLIIRMNSYLPMSKFITTVSFLTIFLAGISSLFEYDVKKLVALSTLSHIGLMILVISIGNCEAAMIHFMTHATFKSSLFMSMGLLIHNNIDFQDIRKLFCSLKSSPKLWTFIMLNTMSMVGFTFMSGFYSKESMILSISEFSSSFSSEVFMLISVCLTSIYSIRMLVYLSVSRPMFSYMMREESLLKASEIAVSIGTVLSIFMGSLISWTLFPKETLIGENFISNSMKFMTSYFLMMGSIFGYFFVIAKPSQMKSFSLFSSSMWFIGSFSFLSVKSVFKFSQVTLNLVENKGWVMVLIKSLKTELSNLNLNLTSTKMSIKPLKFLLMLTFLALMI